MNSSILLYQLLFLAVIGIILAAYLFALVRTAMARGAKRVVLLIILLTPPALILWRMTTSREPEVLAYMSFDGNQAALTAEYHCFFEGYYVTFYYRGAEDPDWNEHSLDNDRFLKPRGVTITNTATGMAVFEKGKLLEEYPFTNLVFKSERTLQADSPSDESYRRALAPYDKRRTAP